MRSMEVDKGAGMDIVKVEKRSDTLIHHLFIVWKRSVEATHLFLSSQEIEEIGKGVPQALQEIPVLVTAGDQGKKPVAFMGINGRKLEMLFVAPKERGKGIGRILIEYGLDHHKINALGVNEQNPQARAFYEHLGFRVFHRTERDEQGRPYPILYMTLS